jgi:hypothetical protein
MKDEMLSDWNCKTLAMKKRFAFSMRRITLGASLLAIFWVVFFVISAPNLHGQTNQTTPGCKDIATIPPVLAFGGPGTVPARANELGFAAGAYGNLFPSPCAHETGVDWFGRWRSGLSNHFDLGVDFQGGEHSSYQVLAVELAARYELLRKLRLEGGLGVGDDTEGKSLNAEVGATMPVRHFDQSWDSYASLRLAGAHGYAGSAFGIGTNVPPGAIVPMGSFGATAHVAENMRWVFEAGGGGILSREHLNAGMFVYVSVGLNFIVGSKK